MNKDLIIQTIVSSLFLMPFLIITIIEPDGFESHEVWHLIFLGGATFCLPISLYGLYRIIKILFKEDVESK